MEKLTIPYVKESNRVAWTLDQISSNYPFVLMDTSAIIGHRHTSKNLNEKKILNLEESDFRSILDYAENHPIYVTKKVLDEVIFKIPSNLSGYNETNLDLRKFYSSLQSRHKDINSNRHGKIIRNSRNFFGTQEKLRQKARDVLRTIDLKNSRIYDLFYETAKNTFSQKLSETDKDFLVHGLLLSLFLPTAIITRDGPMEEAYFGIMRNAYYNQEESSFNQFGCFFRMGKNAFKTYPAVSNRE